MINEGLSERTLNTRQNLIKGMLKNKRALVKRYGWRAEQVMYGKSTTNAKKVTEREAKESLKELIKRALTENLKRILK